MYVIIFAISVFVLTFFESLFLFLCFSAFLLLISFIIRVFVKFSLLRFWIIAIFVLIVSFVCVLLKNILYFQKFDDSFKEKYYVSTWILEQKLGADEYVFQDYKWREFLYYTDKEYTLGQKIKVFAFLNSSKEKCKVCKFDYNFEFISGLVYEFDYNKWLFMKWYYGALYENNFVKLDESIDLDIISFSRQKIKSAVLKTYWKNETWWLLLGLLIWDKSFISDKDYQKFIDSGLVHIIAVSWGNIIMLVVFLSFVLFFVPFYPRLFVIFVFISFYSLICGLESSVFRAWIMWSLWLFALFLWKEIDIFRSMKYAFFAMLIVNPYFLIYDLWFSLSFGALLWIVFMEKLRTFVFNLSFDFFSKTNSSLIKIYKILWNNWVLKNYLFPSLWASLWVLPFLIFFTWDINLLNIVANILIVPLIPFVMSFWLVSIFWTSFFDRIRIFMIEEKLLSYIYFVSDFFAEHWIYLIVEWYRAKLYILLGFISIFCLCFFLFKKS